MWQCVEVVYSTDLSLCRVVCWGWLGKSGSVVYKSVLKITCMVCSMLSIVVTVFILPVGASLGL